MSKRFLLLFLCALVTSNRVAFSQSVDVSVLEREANTMSDTDTLKMIKLTDCALRLFNVNPPETKKYALRALGLAKAVGFHRTIGITNVILGSLASEAGDMDEAHRCFTEGIQAYRDGRLMSKLGQALFQYSRVYYIRQKYPEAQRLVEESAGIYTTLRDEGGIALSKRSLAALHYQQGRHAEALPLFQESLAYSERVGDTKGQEMCLNNIGLILYEQGQKVIATTYYERALALVDKQKDLRGYAELLLSVAQGHRDQGKLRAALDEYLEILDIGIKLGSVDLRNMVMRNIGLSYKDLSDWENAEKYMRAAVALADSSGMLQHQSGNLSTLAISLMHLGRYDEGIDLAKRALELSILSGTLRDELNNKSTLSALYLRKGDFAAAYEHLLNANIVADTLWNKTIREKVAEVSAKYDAERREQQIAMLEKNKALTALELQKQEEELLRRGAEDERNRQRIQLLSQSQEIQQLEIDRGHDALHIERAERERKSEQVRRLEKEKALAAAQLGQQQAVRNSLIGGMVLIGALGFVGVRRVQGRRREAALRAEAAELTARAATAEAAAAREEAALTLLTSQEHERKRIAGDLHDTVGQELLVVKNQLYLALRECTDNVKLRGRLVQAEEMADALLSDVRRISRNLRPLQLERAGLTETLRETTRQVEESSNIRIDATVDPIDGLFDDETEIAVYRVVQEALNNIVRHSKANRADLRVSREEETILVRISDNGCGFDQNRTDGGLGLRSMRERTALLDGSMVVSSTPGAGTTLVFSIPLSMRVQPYSGYPLHDS